MFGLRLLDAAEDVSTAMHVDEGWERAGGQRPVDAGAARAGAGVEHHVLDRGEPRLGLGLAQDRVHPAVMALLFHRLFGAGRNGMLLLERDEPRHQGLGFGMNGHRELRGQAREPGVSRLDHRLVPEGLGRPSDELGRHQKRGSFGSQSGRYLRISWASLRMRMPQSR